MVYGITNYRLRFAPLLLLPLFLAGVHRSVAFQETKAVGEKAAARSKVRLLVTVTGLRNNKGHVAASLFNSDKGFPDEDKHAVARQIATIKDRTASLVFNDLTPGNYGVALLHDENKNDKMDSNRFGFPREGYGVSNNPKPSRRSPKFSDARFTVSPSNKEQAVEIKIVYLRLGDVLR